MHYVIFFFYFLAKNSYNMKFKNLIEESEQEEYFK
jgi:hypothetical protein